jgi:pimeloyl-ACP methyl ester carboxylesterase
MHITEQGEGPLIVLAHDWPELWYSWRTSCLPWPLPVTTQWPPDMRGYGQTDAPPAIKDYTQFSVSWRRG